MMLITMVMLANVNCIDQVGLSKMKANRTLFLNIAFLVAGVSLIGWGASIQKDSIMAANVFISIGGGLMGVGFSSITTYFNDIDILNIIKNSLSAKITSEENAISKYRIKWYHYHLSRMNGKYIWRFCFYDFSKSYDIGRLTSKVDVINSKGEKVIYTIEALRRGTNVVFIQYPEIQSNEEPMIEVFPFMGKHYLSPYYGMMYIESWDGTEILAPSIISEIKVQNWAKIGNVDEATGLELSKMWKQNFNDKIDIFPLTI